MKHSFLLLAASGFLLFTSCVKYTPGDLPDRELKLCPILTLESKDTINSTDPGNQFTIHYNASGNPVDMLQTVGQPYSDVEYHFRYDKFNRLTDFIQNYTGSSGALIWHRYSYPAKRIVIDSVYNYGNALITDPAPDPTDYPYSYIVTLDQEGRIIKEQTPGSPSFDSYQYDARGNMVLAGVTYDNKINPYRTNAVWQFIFKDYSANNPLTPPATGPVTYNAVGLPLVIKGSPYLFGHSFYTELHLEYACDPGGKAR